MSELQEISDLRPAPRTTPTPVLWLMLTAAVSGAGVLALPFPLGCDPVDRLCEGQLLDRLSAVMAAARQAGSSASSARARGMGDR
jgi:hypothetical protein